MNNRVERNDEGYAGAEEVLGIRRSEDVVAEGQITAGGVHGSGILVERACALAMLNYWGVRWIMWMVGFGKLSLIFPGRAMLTP